MIEKVRMMYQGGATKLLINGKKTRRIAIGRGIKQGSASSPLLFNLTMTHLQEKLCARYLGVKLEGMLLPTLMYMDDAVLLASSLEELQEMMQVTEE